MGYTTAQVTATARLSRHNSDQDEMDNERWEGFCERFATLAYEYRDVVVDTMIDRG
jgi:hypothetical protein